MSKKSVILFNIPSEQTFRSYICMLTAATLQLYASTCGVEDQYFALAGACYITCRQSQSSLHYQFFILVCYSMFHKNEVCTLRLLLEVSGF